MTAERACSKPAAMYLDNPTERLGVAATQKISESYAPLEWPSDFALFDFTDLGKMRAQ